MGGGGSIFPAKRLSLYQRILRAVPLTHRRDLIDNSSVYTPHGLGESSSSVRKPVPAFCSRCFLWKGAACAGRGGALGRRGSPHPVPTRWGGGKSVSAPAYPGSGRGGPGGARDESMKTPGICLARPRVSLPAHRLILHC